MTTVRQLKLAADAGDPDSVLALRIDVVAAAEAWYDAPKGNWREMVKAEEKLEIAVRRYKAALRQRRR